MNWFVLFCYIFAMYGLTIIVTQSMGPFNIFYKWRQFTADISDNLGLLFRCQLCFPTNAGIASSLLNWFLLPSLKVTPFNMILAGTNLWWVAALMDGFIVGGTCHIIWNIDDYIDKNTPIYEDE